MWHVTCLLHNDPETLKLDAMDKLLVVEIKETKTPADDQTMKTKEFLFNTLIFNISELCEPF